MRKSIVRGYKKVCGRKERIVEGKYKKIFIKLCN